MYLSVRALINRPRKKIVSFPARVTCTPPPPPPPRQAYFLKKMFHIICGGWWAVWSAPGERAVPVPGRGGLGGN